jgi:GR25 family glycosyltransferase involved in LPS biosynthesis
MKSGELGCAWSHLNIYEQLLKEPSDMKYLILEDDANLVESLDYLYVCLKNLPNDFDMCHIAMSDWYPFIKTDKINEYWYRVAKQYFNRLTAYIISKKGAHKIINYTNNWINVPADDLLSNMHIEHNLQVIVPETYAFMEKINNVSIIHKISTNN